MFFHLRNYCASIYFSSFLTTFMIVLLLLIAEFRLFLIENLAIQSLNRLLFYLVKFDIC